jgi:hypothetical protein
LFAVAHTSDERYVDGIIVDLSTAPIAPWVGEKVGFLFSFLDTKNFQVIDTVKSAQISIVATFRANGKPQEEIYLGTSTPVVRGTLNFDHVFTEVGTYDVHISFVTTDGKEHVTGYRRQIRDGTTSESGSGHGWGYDAFIGLVGATFGTLVTRYALQHKRISGV